MVRLRFANFTIYHAQQNFDEEFDLDAAGEDVEFDETTALLKERREIVIQRLGGR